MTESETPSQEPKRVLIVMAHPDDGEFGSGGTLARWAARGPRCLLLPDYRRPGRRPGRQGDHERGARRRSARWRRRPPPMRWACSIQ